MEEDLSAKRSSSFRSPLLKSPSFSGLRRTLSSSRNNHPWDASCQDPEKGIMDGNHDGTEESGMPWPVANGSRGKRSVREIRASQSLWRRQANLTSSAWQLFAKSVSASARLLIIGFGAVLVMVGCLQVSDMVSVPMLDFASGAAPDLLRGSEGFVGHRPSRRLMEAKSFEERIGSAIASEVIRKMTDGKLSSKLAELLEDPSSVLPPIEQVLSEIIDVEPVEGSESVESESSETEEVEPSSTNFLDGSRTLMYSPSLHEICLPTVQEWRDAFLCAIGDAVKSKRTWVMDPEFCVEAFSIPGHPYRSVLDFHLYYDMDGLQQKLNGRIINSHAFWNELDLYNAATVSDTVRVADVSADTDVASEAQPLVRRAIPESDRNPWSSVCEHDKGIEKPEEFLQIHPALMEMAAAMANEMENDFDSVHVTIDPNAEATSQVEAVIAHIRKTFTPGRRIFIAIDDYVPSQFSSLREFYSIYTLHDFQKLWSYASKWARIMKEETGHKSRVIFDSYRRFLVHEELIQRSKQTFDNVVDTNLELVSAQSDSKHRSLRLRLGEWEA